MTAHFQALYETPAAPEAFDRHYREVHIPLGCRLPGLRRYAIGRDIAAVRGAPYYLVAELEWDTMDELRAAATPFPGPRPPGPRRCDTGAAGTAPVPYPRTWPPARHVRRAGGG
jgi:uncharacterized protein (TIGR02118 family)